MKNSGDAGQKELPYEIYPSNYIYSGKTYSDLVSDWFNWFLSIDADKRTLGPVVFLKSLGISSDSGGYKDSEMGEDLSPSTKYGDDLYYPRIYPNSPNLRVGTDRVQIYTDQAIFFPVIVAYWIGTKPFHDWGLMQEFNGLTIDYGDNPPGIDQFKIYDGGTDISPNKDLRNFRVSTPVFPAVVPEADYGRSVKDFLEESITPGLYPAMAEGYFVLLKFNKSPENGRSYFIHSFASAPRETKGPYFSELLYEIEVKKRPEKVSVGAPGFRLSRNEGTIAKVLGAKVSSGEIASPLGSIIGKILKINIVDNIQEFKDGKDKKK